MALSKSSSFFLSHIKALTKPHKFPHPLSLSLSSRLLSFATPEEAAAERRHRKRRLRIEPPLNSLRPQTQQRSPTPTSAPNTNPNAPKIPESVTALTGNRLNLHNRILTLIRQNDLDEAALYTRHSVYSNCRPTIFTCNAVMTALLRQSRYSDLLSLHRFITQAGIAGNVVTFNLIITVYCECRKTDTALEYYKQLVNDAPFNPSPTTYRILVKGLVENGNKVDKAVELKDEMLGKGFEADSIVYSYLMNGFAKAGEWEKIFSLYDELKEKLGGEVNNGVVIGGLMKGCFLKGSEEEAMSWYDEATGVNSGLKMGAMAFNFILEALCKNGKFDQALRLFDRMKDEHNPPTNITVNLGSYNVIADGYCAEGRFKEAIEVFMSMDEKGCYPDTLSFNNLIEKLCDNGLLPEAEELCGRMGEKNCSPDEVSYVLLMEACFKESRSDDAAAYFTKMIDSNLRPNLAVYNKLVEGLVKVGKIDEAKSYFDLMVKKLKMDAASYEFMFKVLSDAGRMDEVMAIVNDMLDEAGLDINSDMEAIIKDGLRQAGREEEELPGLIEQKEREKEEVKRKEVEEAERVKARHREAVASLLPPKVFGNKEEEGKDSNEVQGVSGDASQEGTIGDLSDGSSGGNEQTTTTAATTDSSDGASSGDSEQRTTTSSF